MKNILLFVISFAVCCIVSCKKDDCINYSGCFENTEKRGQEKHDILGEFVMPYDDCLIDNISGTIDSIPTGYNPLNDFAVIKDSLGTVVDSLDCKIPFYADFLLGRLPEDSIKALITLRFNSIFDNINNKILATEWIINNESKKCNDTRIDLYVKTDGTKLYKVNCIIYSTDFSNVYVHDINFSFAVTLSEYGDTPTLTNDNNIGDGNVICTCEERCNNMPAPVPGYGTVIIILPSPG